MTNPNQALLTAYIVKINENPDKAAEYVDTLTHEERKIIRSYLEDTENPKALRNLYYDYKTQVWID